MPTAFTHQLIAEDAITPSRAETLRLADYYFGAQGPDPFFFYRFFTMRKNNLGRLLHKDDVYGTFECMLEYSRTHPAALGYALGYITHYAADAVFHPYVYYYAFSRCGTRSGRSALHTQMESDFDSYFLSKEGTEVGEYRLPYSPSDLDLADITGMFMAVFAEKGIAVVAKDVYRAVRGWFRYLRFTLDPHYRKGKFWRGVGKWSKNCRRLGAMFRRKDINEDYLNLPRAEWHYRDDPEVVSDAGADALFEKAVSDSRALIDEFMDCYYSREPLPRALFGKHLLSGI